MDLGQNNHMLLVNHGGLTVGETVGDAFMRFYDLQRACEIQLMMQARWSTASNCASSGSRKYLCAGKHCSFRLDRWTNGMACNAEKSLSS